MLTATGQELAAKLSVAFAGVESLVRELVGEGGKICNLRSAAALARAGSSNGSKTSTRPIPRSTCN